MKPAPLPRNAQSARQIVSLSGGKDSVATYLVALERGRAFQAVFADTGNEHPDTLEYVKGLAFAAKGPEIEWVKADFSGEFERKRDFIRERWPLDGIPQDFVDRAVACLVPSGIPFLDLCMLKGRFPGDKSRFCTTELKLRPMDDIINVPYLDAGWSVVNWTGERAEESPGRAAKPAYEQFTWKRPGVFRGTYRPIHGWTARQVFAMHRRHGVSPNPLYSQGMARVGCMPCIMVKKGELRTIAARFPTEIDRIEEWEGIVAAVSKRMAATFFCAKMLPGKDDDPTKAAIRKAVAWAGTKRGGREFDADAASDDKTLCQSAYGLCE